MRTILSRRALLGGIAAGATSAILAACGGGTVATSTPSAAPTTAATGGATAPPGALSNIATQVADRLTPAAATPTTIAPTAAATAAPSATAIPATRVAATPTPSSTAGMVYALSNQESDNQVAIFSRRADGKLTFERAVSTGGKGVGEQQDGEGLGSQGAALLSPDGKFLFVCNGGSKDISVFGVQDTNLTMVQKISSNGPRPISLTMHGAILYSLNFSRQQPTNGNITGFTVGSDGKLTPLANSMKPLSNSGNVDPGQVLFSPKGDLLVVTEKATNKLVSYTVGANGIASAPTAFASGGEAPFSFAFVNDTLLVTADNFGDAQNKGAASSFSIGDKGSLKLVSKAVPDKQTGACWITVSKDGTYAWVVNTGAATVSGYQIDPSGKLTLLSADGITARAGAKPRDIAQSVDGKFLYVLNSGEGTVEGFAVQANGKLESLGEAGKFPAPGGIGLAAR
jgi:6-phosphogluconolactonase